MDRLSAGEARLPGSQRALHCLEKVRASFVRSRVSFTRAVPHDLITSQRPNRLPSPCFGVRFQHMHLGHTAFSLQLREGGR